MRLARQQQTKHALLHCCVPAATTVALGTVQDQSAVQPAKQYSVETLSLLKALTRSNTSGRLLAHKPQGGYNKHKIHRPLPSGGVTALLPGIT